MVGINNRGNALAAATEGGDGTAPGEASQSGAESATPTLPDKYQFDLDTMTARIEELEEALEQIQATTLRTDIDDPEIVARVHTKASTALARGETVK